MAIEISKERTAVFPYKLGDHTLHAIIAMWQGRHNDYARKNYPLRNENGEIQKGENGLPLIDWNAAGENYYQTFFRGFEEEITIDGVPINSKSPDGKKKVEANMPMDFGGWVLRCAKDTAAFYAAAKDAQEGLPPGPGGPTD